MDSGADRTATIEKPAVRVATDLSSQGSYFSRGTQREKG